MQLSRKIFAKWTKLSEFIFSHFIFFLVQIMRFAQSLDKSTTPKKSNCQQVSKMNSSNSRFSHQPKNIPKRLSINRMTSPSLDFHKQMDEKHESIHQRNDNSAANVDSTNRNVLNMNVDDTNCHQINTM